MPAAIEINDEEDSRDYEENNEDFEEEEERRRLKRHFAEVVHHIYNTLAAPGNQKVTRERHRPIILSAII